MKNKINLLKNVELFSVLKKDELKIIAENSDYEEYEKGVELYNKRNSFDELYIVKEGEIVIKKKIGANKQQVIARFIENESFGEMNLFKNFRRPGSACTQTPTVLLHFPKNGSTFKDIMSGHPEMHAKLLRQAIAMIANRIRDVNKLISEKTPWVHEIRKKLFIDRLTGLFNRNYILEDFPFFLQDSVQNLSLIYMKPDNFKDINDNYGHETGDGVLILIAVFLYSLLERNDIGVRYSGDEFIIILPETSPEEACTRAEKINETINNIDLSNFTNNEPFQILFSMGISHYPSEANDEKALVEIASEKMHKVRKKGGDGINV